MILSLKNSGYFNYIEKEPDNECSYVTMIVLKLKHTAIITIAKIVSLNGTKNKKIVQHVRCVEQQLN